MDMDEHPGRFRVEDLPAAFTQCTVRVVKLGFGRTVYQLEDAAGRSFIVKQGNLTADSGSSIEKEVVVLQFLASKNISFVPQVLHWDSTADISIETYVGSHDHNFADLDDAMLNLFVTQLHAVHTLPVKALLENAKEHDLKVQFSATELFDIYGFSRLEIARRGCPDTALIEWLETRLEHTMRMLPPRPPGSAHLLWGDIGRNLRADNQQLFFIDWEHSRVGHGSELAYIRNHSHVPKPLFDKMIRLYADLSNTTQEQLQADMALDDRITRINDVIWAAMQWARASTDEEAMKYKKLTYDRRRTAKAYL